MKKKIELILLLGILLLGFTVRLYRFNNPIGEWHAFRQADTSAVSKVFVEKGINPLYPKYFDISNIQSGKDNPEGYRFVEFPIYNVFQAGLFVTLNTLTLEEWGRLVTIFSSLLSILFIFLLVRKHLDSLSALFASFFYAVLPFSVFYGRVILPDPTTAMTILGGLWFFDLWVSRRQHTNKNMLFFALAIVLTAFSFLLKPFALFFTLPFLYIAWKEYGWKTLYRWQLWVFLVVTIIPLILWRLWLSQYPQGVPASTWLFNEGGIRFTGAYFYWIFAERIGKLILGYFGVVLLFLGLFKRNEKDYLFFFSFLLSAILYMVVIARGNVQHDYYQILILPAICIFLGRGATLLLSLPALMGKNIQTNTFISIMCLFVISVFTLFFSWYYVRDYFNINNQGLITAGKEADKVLPKKAKVIAANNGDTSFLYYINRKGWPAYQKSPEELKLMGATHIVIPSPTEEDLKGLGTTFKRSYSTKDVLILEL